MVRAYRLRSPVPASSGPYTLKFQSWIPPRESAQALLFTTKVNNPIACTAESSNLHCHEQLVLLTAMAKTFSSKDVNFASISHVKPHKNPIYEHSIVSLYIIHRRRSYLIVGECSSDCPDSISFSQNELPTIERRSAYCNLFSRA